MFRDKDEDALDGGGGVGGTGGRVLGETGGGECEEEDELLL